MLSQVKVKKPDKIFVAMSGGVDSSVAVALLKKRGFEARGIHIKMWSDPDIPCNFKEDRYDAMRVAAKLDIPFETWDFTAEYREAVVDYMIREYAAGRTPNPDVMCNSRIKFGVFLKRALERGADYIATGHYVRREPEFPIFKIRPFGEFTGFARRKQRLLFPTQFSNNDSISKFSNLKIGSFENSLKIENCKLKIAKDVNKDQSYFLWTLTQEQLRHCLFPIGEYTKPEVRLVARKLSLSTADKPDSQGICFIGEINIRAFLKSRIAPKPGAVLTTSGRKVGKHEGLPFYTIGQREGLGIGGGIPYYVTTKDFKTNSLLVAEGPYDEKLFSKKVRVTGFNWISERTPKFPLKCQARIRYRQPLQDCTLDLQPTTRNLQTVFDEPQRAVTPGQSIVFYQGEEVLGGGVLG